MAWPPRYLDALVGQVRRGPRVFVAIAELNRWLERSPALTLDR